MGLLLVTMEPPPAMTEEFHDWYDTEHVPERLALPGFHTATRWVCLQGWPRYLALYDLDSPATLDTPDYLAVSAANVSPWSHRVLPRTAGRVRVVAQQAMPGDADTWAPERTALLAVARYPGTLASAAPDLPGLVQSRLFHRVDGPAETWLLAAFDRSLPLHDVQAALATQGGAGALMTNIYVPYVRASPN